MYRCTDGYRCASPMLIIVGYDELLGMQNFGRRVDVSPLSCLKPKQIKLYFHAANKDKMRIVGIVLQMSNDRKEQTT